MSRRLLILACSLVAVGCPFDPETPGVTDGNVDSSSGSDSSASGTLDTTMSASGDPTTATTASTTSDPSDTDDPTDPTETTGPESCGGGAGFCVTIPEEWTGPVAVAHAEPGVTPDCAGLEATVTASANLDAPASCACECAAAEGAACTSALLASYGDDATCASETVFTQVIDGGGGGDPCNFMPGGDNTGEVPLEAASWWTITTTSEGGTCAPQPTLDIPTPTYAATVSGCAVNELDMACDTGGTCFEAPGDSFATGLCVWRSGTHECPAGDFYVRTVHNRGDLSDGRSCTECTCGDASGSCPSSEALVFDGYYCNGPGVPVGSACSEVCQGENCATYAVSSTISFGAAEATCPPSGGESSASSSSRIP